VPTEVSEFTTAPVMTVESDTTVAAAADAMDRKEIHSLVVITDDCRPAGVFTSTDLIAAVADDVDLATTTVEEWMTVDVITVAPGDAIESVAALMHERDIGHVPVVEEQVIGIVTESDLREYLAASPDSTD
jgi:CBS domain-containing protein